MKDWSSSCSKTASQGGSRWQIQTSDSICEEVENSNVHIMPLWHWTMNVDYRLQKLSEVFICFKKLRLIRLAFQKTCLFRERVRSSFHYSWKQSGSSGPTCNFANDDGYKSNEMFFLAVLSFFFLHSTSFGCLSVCLNDKQFGPCGAVFQYRYGPPSLPSSIDHTIPITKKLYFEKVIVSQNIFKTYLWQL